MPRSRRTVAVFTYENDHHAAAVAEEIIRLGHDCILLSCDDYCVSWTLSWTVVSGQTKCIISTPQGTIDCSEIDAWWIRREPTFAPGEEVENGTERYVNSQRSILLHMWLHWIAETAFCIDPPSHVTRAKSKILQQEVARTVGLLVPETYVGGDPEEAEKWINSVSGPLISKAVEANRLKREDGSSYAKYTSMFERRTGDKLASLYECPVTLQSFVSKSLELRVTIVGDSLFSASIDVSGSDEASKVDWRHYDWANTVYRRFNLPTEIQTQLLALMSELKLTYGAVDMVLTPELEYVFLEVNPTGQYLWVEDLTDLPITTALAQTLVRGA